MDVLFNDNSSLFIYSSTVVGVMYSIYQFVSIRKIEVKSMETFHFTREMETVPLVDGVSLRTREDETHSLREVSDAISEGSNAFLKSQYYVCFQFIAVAFMIIFLLISLGQRSYFEGILTSFSFLCGSITSCCCGYIGMKMATFCNVRTTTQAMNPTFFESYNVAFSGGSLFGVTLTTIALAMLYTILLIYSYLVPSPNEVIMANCVAGFGLGGSAVALFGRVGGGIFTKAADVGADLVGKVVHGIPEDDRRNPATIADNVGDNVGDIAGMGADLFGSFAESICATLVICCQIDDVRNTGWSAIVYALLVAASGVLVGVVTYLLGRLLAPVKTEKHIDRALRLQLALSAVLIVVPIFQIGASVLPDQFRIVGISGDEVNATNVDACVCVVLGVLAGLLIGFSAEYYTSNAFQPVRSLTEACVTGPACNIINGIALGYESCVLPTMIHALLIYTAFNLCDLYGVALAAIGMLSTIATALSIDAFGPICDNAGGIAEMARLNASVREKTDALDAAGNTTAAVGKGFAIGSAVLVSLALLGAFAVRVKTLAGNEAMEISLMNPIVFAFLLLGANLPCWFTSLTMKSVGEAAMKMIEEVKRQFEERPELLDAHSDLKPDYARCIEVATKASLKEMLNPSLLVFLTPLITGTFFGIYAVVGLLTGSILSGLQLAISQSNSGGAWDNAKKFIAASHPTSFLGGKEGEPHKAAVIGDTVGDPMKDTSGPSLNILMKLMAITSLVFAEYFYSINNGAGLLNLTSVASYANDGSAINMNT